MLPREHVWTVLTIAMNYILKPLASSHIQSWYEGTILSEMHPDLPISSQSISKLFDQIGNSSTHIDFSNKLIQKISTSRTPVYDITSISSYSQMINFLECCFTEGKQDGRFILLYRGKFGWEECLSLYRSKDVVEKGFDVMKNELDVMPANVRKDSIMRGYLFICFLSLILRMRLMKLMREAGLSSKYSVETLVTELEKNRVMILPDRAQIVTEQTMRQKEIFKVLCANRRELRIYKLNQGSNEGTGCRCQTF